MLFATFFSAVLLLVTSFARSFKEAQAYVVPLMVVCLAPGFMSVMPGLELGPLLSVVPLANIVLLARDVLEGRRAADLGRGGRAYRRLLYGGWPWLWPPACLAATRFCMAAKARGAICFAGRGDCERSADDFRRLDGAGHRGARCLSSSAVCWRYLQRRSMSSQLMAAAPA